MQIMTHPMVARHKTPPGRNVIVLHNTDPGEASDFFRGIAQYRPAGGPWRLLNLLTDGPNHAAAPKQIIRRLNTMEFDGIISKVEDQPLLDKLHRRGVRVVDVHDNTRPRKDRPYPLVCLDHRQIGRIAAEHLLQRGFSRLMYLGFDISWSRFRAEAFCEVAKPFRATCHVVYTPQWDELLSLKWITAQLRRVPHPLGVMTCNDTVGAHVIAAAGNEGWLVPSRVAVIGVDDRITECYSVQPPLSTISIERFQAGFEAARLLDKQFSGPRKVGEVFWLRPQRVIERESTSAHVFVDSDVAEALTYIRRSACEGITVKDVLNHLSMSRSTLDRRFRLLVGHSPGDEIRRIRLDAVKRSLEQSRRPLFEIASSTGFASVSSLSHSFRAATGMAPHAYRRSLRSPKPF